MRGRPCENKNVQKLEPRFDKLTNTLTSVLKDNLILEIKSQEKKISKI